MLTDEREELIALCQKAANALEADRLLTYVRQINALLGSDRQSRSAEDSADPEKGLEVNGG